MIIDSSVLVAILQEEPEARNFEKAILAAELATMSAAAYLESGIVVDKANNPALSDRLDAVIDELGIEIAVVTEAHARAARDAHRRFGRGSGHPAKLNFGDCFAYALAVERGRGLLFKGNDFSATDVERARY